MSSKKNKSCILTSYFCAKPHPQRFDPNNEIKGINGDGYVLRDSWRYMRDFYSTSSSSECEIFIFHDSLSRAFVDKFSLDNLHFIKVVPSVFSNNDYRFKCYFDWLVAHHYDKVFMSDLCDVSISMDPSGMEIDFDLFFCEDIIDISGYQFGSKSYFEMHKSFNWENENLFKDNNFKLLNMGVIGGNYDNVYKFLNLFCELRIKAGNPDLNINMALGNYIARNFFSDIRHGFPYCSEFKKYQTDREDVFFIHK